MSPRRPRPHPPGPLPSFVWWDRGDDSAGKVSFPVAADKAQALEDLVSDCQPTVFGHGAKNTFDESVRKAWAMDSSRFMTNLCP